MYFILLHSEAVEAVKSELDTVFGSRFREDNFTITSEDLQAMKVRCAQD